jgi:hypothetical protein
MHKTKQALKKLNFFSYLLLQQNKIYIHALIYCMYQINCEVNLNNSNVHNIYFLLILVFNLCFKTIYQ